MAEGNGEPSSHPQENATLTDQNQLSGYIDKVWFN